MSTYGERDSGVWEQALSDLTEDELREGLTKMMRDLRFETWPPNCTQFRHLCASTRASTPPSVMLAFREVQQNKYRSRPTWSHLAIKMTIKCIGVHIAYKDDEREAFKEFSKKYEQVCARMAGGHPLPEIADCDVKAPEIKRSLPPQVSENIKHLLSLLTSSQPLGVAQ